MTLKKPKGKFMTGYIRMKRLRIGEGQNDIKCAVNIAVIIVWELFGLLTSTR